MGKTLEGHRVELLCDNQPAVFAMNRRSFRDRDMMGLIRCIFFLEALLHFELLAVYLPGRKNTLPDDLSRN